MHVVGSKEQEDGTFHINSKLLLDRIVNTIKGRRSDTSPPTEREKV